MDPVDHPYGECSQTFAKRVILLCATKLIPLLLPPVYSARTRTFLTLIQMLAGFLLRNGREGIH